MQKRIVKKFERYVATVANIFDRRIVYCFVLNSSSTEEKDIQLSGILIELRFGQQNCYTACIIYQVKQRVTGKSYPV